MSQPSIFVAIPAYRDAELSMTVDRLIAQADHPRRLSFGICQQDIESDWVDFNRYKGIINFRLDNYLPEQSNGSGWALGKSHALYNGEDYFLQIDAHIECVSGWDTILLKTYEQFQQVQSGPAVMATYPAAYNLDANGNRVLDEFGYISKTRMVYDGSPSSTFPTGNAVYMGDTSRPVKARYLNGGFMFGHGSFSHQVPYDPDLIYWGVEIVTTVRMWTHGFNLYHPNAAFAWHHYGDRLNARKGRPHVWNTEDDAKRAVSYADRNARSYDIVNQILCGTYQGLYGVGTARSLQDFEAYAGINFQTHERTEECISGNYTDC